MSKKLFLKNFFSSFSFFANKLVHLTINDFFLYVTNTQAYQQKRKNSSLVKKKVLQDRLQAALAIRDFGIRGLKDRE